MGLYCPRPTSATSHTSYLSIFACPQPPSKGRNRNRHRRRNEFIDFTPSLRTNHSVCQMKRRPLPQPSFSPRPQECKRPSIGPFLSPLNVASRPLSETPSFASNSRLTQLLSHPPLIHHFFPRHHCFTPVSLFREVRLPRHPLDSVATLTCNPFFSLPHPGHSAAWRSSPIFSFYPLRFPSPSGFSLVPLPRGSGGSTSETSYWPMSRTG